MRESAGAWTSAGRADRVSRERQCGGNGMCPHLKREDNHQPPRDLRNPEDLRARRHKNQNDRPSRLRRYILRHATLGVEHAGPGREVWRPVARDAAAAATHRH